MLDVLKGHDVIAGCLNQTIDEIWNCGTSRCLGWSTSLTNLFLNQFSTSKETSAGHERGGWRKPLIKGYASSLALSRVNWFLIYFNFKISVYKNFSTLSNNSKLLKTILI